MKLRVIVLLFSLLLVGTDAAVAEKSAPAPATGPTLTTFHLHETTLDQLINELARQSGLPLRIDPPLLDDATLVSFDADAMPALLALRALCEQKNLEPVSSPGVILLGRRDPNPQASPDAAQACFAHSPCYALCGPVLVVATNAWQDNAGGLRAIDAGRRGTFINLAMIVDGGTRLIGANSNFTVDEAIDDRGNNLVLPVVPTAYQPVNPHLLNSRFDVRAGIVSPAYTLSRLTLKGRLRVILPHKEEQLVFDDLTQNAAIEKTIVGLRCRLSPEVKTGEDRDLSITLVHDARWSDRIARLDPLLPPANMDLLQLTDALGQPTAYRIVSHTLEPGGDLTIRLRVHVDNPAAPADPANPLREPAKLIWTVPVEVKEMDIPVVLKEIPLP